MTNENFTLAFTVAEAPDAVFAAINNVRGWWSEDIEGCTDRRGETFDYRFQDIHRCTMQVTDLIPGRTVAWRVLDNYFNFTRDRSEWKGTEIVFNLSPKGDGTEVRFTHVGLVPEYECYGACSEGWGYYIGTSLRELIATGKGRPNVGQALTENERALAG